MMDACFVYDWLGVKWSCMLINFVQWRDSALHPPKKLKKQNKNKEPFKRKVTIVFNILFLIKFFDKNFKHTCQNLSHLTKAS